MPDKYYSMNTDTLITKEPTKKSPPAFLSHIPVECDHFLNVRCTEEFKNRVRHFSKSRRTSMSKSILTAMETLMGPMN